MEREQIEAFLSIVQTGTISAAADSLYTTQSSISKRISVLEKELGVPLFYRGKGIRRVELTPYGEEFLRIAGKWESVNREFKSIPYISSLQEVSIGATDMTNRITLKGLYRDFLLQYSDIRLDIHSYHSPQIYRMMESGSLDLGLVNLLLPVSQIIVKKVVDEPFVIVMYTKNPIPETVSYRDLDPSKEIYSRWNDEFAIWHDQYWPGRYYRIHVGSGSMISDYLNEEGRWCIAPATCIQELSKEIDVKHAKLDLETPKRSLYILEQKQIRPHREQAVRLVKTSLLNYLKTCRD